MATPQMIVSDAGSSVARTRLMSELNETNMSNLDIQEFMQKEREKRNHGLSKWEKAGRYAFYTFIVIWFLVMGTLAATLVTVGVEFIAS